MSIYVGRRPLRGNPVVTDIFDLGPTRNRLHVARPRANILGIGGDEKNVNWTHNFADKEAANQMINRAKNALKTNPFMLNVYFKLQGGRRCSCWGKGETPDGYCCSCFKTGWVGGYEKHRCQTDLIDSTHPDLSMVNIQPDLKSGRVPIPLSLISKATRGSIEIPVKLKPNVGVLDLFKVYSQAPEGTKIEIFVRKSQESDWVPANDKTISSRLQSGVIVFKVEMSRSSVETNPPYLKAIRLRYQIQKGDSRVPFNIPLGEEAFQLQEMGIWESYSTISLFSDSTLKAIRNEDWVHNPRDNRRFMITSAKLFNPTNSVVSWTLQARFIQSLKSGSDAVAEFPI